MLRNNESRYSQINDVIDMVNNKKMILTIH